ncbi:MAG: cardiolipin synthase, partial [Proteobacteria bacterium]
MAAGDVLTIALPVLIVALDALAVSHAVLHKHDTRAAIGWVGVILSLPLLGAALYWALG